MYYLRTKPAAQAIQFTVDKTRLLNSSVANSTSASPELLKLDKLNLDQKTEEDKENVADNDGKESQRNKNMAILACSLQNREECMMCGS